MLRTILRSVLRAPVGEEDGGGGGTDAAAELAKTKAELATLKASQAAATKALKDAETARDRANGELSKVLDAKEAELAAEKKRADDAVAVVDGLTKKERQSALTKAVAAKLGVDVDPILIGLLPQTGEDIAPEKLSDQLVGKVAESVRKLAPNLKPKSNATSAASTGARDSVSGEIDYFKLGQQLAGK